MIGLADLNAPLCGVLAQARNELLRVRRIVAESEDGGTASGDASSKATKLS